MTGQVFKKETGEKPIGKKTNKKNHRFSAGDLRLWQYWNVLAFVFQEDLLTGDHCSC